MHLKNSTIASHGWPWSNVENFTMVDHGHIRLTMVKAWFLAMMSFLKSMVDHGLIMGKTHIQTWLTVVEPCFFT